MSDRACDMTTRRCVLRPDAGDAGDDASSDASADAPLDVAIDTAPDASPDVVPDASPDAVVDVPKDVARGDVPTDDASNTLLTGGAGEGCGCSTPGSNPSRPATGLFALAMILLARRRSRGGSSPRSF
jgi:MYXO-CTERM domain-containing protein